MPRTHTDHSTAPALEREFVDVWRKLDQINESVQVVGEPAGAGDTIILETTGLADISVVTKTIDLQVGNTLRGAHIFNVGASIFLNPFTMLTPIYCALHVLRFTGPPFDFLTLMKGDNTAVWSLVTNAAGVRESYSQQQIGQFRVVTGAGHYEQVQPFPPSRPYDAAAQALWNPYNTSMDRTTLGWPLVPLVQPGSSSPRALIFQWMGWRGVPETTPTCLQANVEFRYALMPRELWGRGCA